MRMPSPEIAAVSILHGENRASRRRDDPDSSPRAVKSQHVAIAILLLALAALSTFPVVAQVTTNTSTVVETWSGDPNFVGAFSGSVAPGPPIPASLPIWWDQGPFLVFAKDHSVGYYVGRNAQGSWIRHESGTVYVFNRANGTLTVGAASLDQVPADVAQSAAQDPKHDVRPRVRGIITRGSNGLATLTYDLLEPGKPPRKMTITGLFPTNEKLGNWAWIGDPSQADPAALADLRPDELQRLQLNGLGERPGSAAQINVDSSGDVFWQFQSRINTAPYFAHGERGKLTRQPDGSFHLSFTLVVPGKTNREISLSVARSKIVVSRLMEDKFIFGGCGDQPNPSLPINPTVPIVPPLLDASDAWVWTDANHRDPFALLFNLLPDGWVRWSLAPPATAHMFLAGPTPADSFPGSASPRASGATGAKAPAPLPPSSGAQDDPNLPVQGALTGPPYRTAVVWTYTDSPAPSVWRTGTQVFETLGRPLGEPFVYLGFNADGSWLESCDGTAVYTWNGAAQQLTMAAHNMSAVPSSLSNPSEFMRRYAAQQESANAASAHAAAVSQNQAPDRVDPLQAAGFIPGDAGPSTFSASVGNSNHGTGAQVRDGMLTYRDAQSGATVSLRVQRPAFIAAQPQMLKAMGTGGTWIWVSDDRQQGRVINVAQDGSVTVTVIPAQIAIGMISGGAPH